MTLQKDPQPIPGTPSIPSQTPIQVQVAAKSSLGSRRKPTEVPTRADDSEKYETS